MKSNSKEHDRTKQTKIRRKMKSPLPKVADNFQKKEPPEESSQYLHYGVLGIGRLGSKLVKKLIKTGRKVFIWNRTIKKCEILLNELDHSERSYAKICYIPSLVIQKSDIIFNCISECNGSKDVIEQSLADEFAPDNFMLNKGLIDMSGLDLVGQEQIYKLVRAKGGKHLEVRIQFREEIIDGGYLFLVGGDEELFATCQHCFNIFGGSSIYLGDKTGYVNKLNLVMQLIKSVYLLGITEGFSLLERSVPLNQVIVPILFRTPIASDYFKKKSLMIFCEKFDLVEQSLQNFAKDIHLGMEMSNSVSESMFLPSLVDQIFKHSQKLGYGNEDPSAVFMRVRH